MYAHRSQSATFTLSPRNPVDRVVGGVAGSVSVFLLLGVLVFWRRRKAKSAEQTFIRNIMETTAVPYTATHSGPYTSTADRKESSRNAHTAREPLTVPAVAAAADEMQELDLDVAGTPAEPGQVQRESAQVAHRVQTESVVTIDNIEAVPGLVERLNRIMARLPPGGVTVEEPPAYHIV